MTTHPRVSEPEIPSSEPIFTKALTVVDRSGADVLIDQWRTEKVVPTKRSDAVAYTVRAFLTALLCVLLRRSEPTVRTVFRTILDFTPDQLQRVGIDAANLEPTHEDPVRALKNFRSWTTRTFECLDPAPDQPARMISVADHKKIAKARTPEQIEAYRIAAERLSIVVNRIVAGSIDPAYAKIGRGDIMVDETILDTASVEQLFSGGTDLRGAVYCGGYYRRDKSNQVSQSKTDGPKVKKRGWGLGVTAVSAIPEPNSLHRRPTLFTGIAIHPPTSGSLEGLDEAVQHHQMNGFDARSSSARARWPMLTIDMGYLKKGLFDWQVEHRYAAVFTYPKHWNVDSAAIDVNGERLGPVQLSGNWYCPAAAEISLGRDFVVRLRDVLTKDDWEARNTRLSDLLPLLMGLDRRPIVRRDQMGRPTEGDETTEAARMVLVCPAALGNVRCTRWQNEETEGRLDLPLVDLPESTPEFRCCTQPTVTASLTEDQKRLQQLGPYAPGSFEHAVYHEAVRSKTEQRFSLLKRRTVAGLGNLNYGARREPMVKITIAAAFAVVNIGEIERFEAQNAPRPESIKLKFNRLERDLGKPPTRMPKRT
ncbi:hypothetical protein [Gordonia sp. VNK21]|uniref:hypothetical protein n=1 Tax=Gordonia sp. VNK21 TaxID=3382483 RepID=UPI0038D44663